MGIRRNSKKEYHHIRDDDFYNEKSIGMLDDNVNRDFHPNTNEVNVDDQILLQEIKIDKCIDYK
jgi:hypothetical protein